jgi:lipoate-protein ligase B
MVIKDFGLRNFESILHLQEKIISDKIDNKDSVDYCLLGEHADIVTLGRRPEQETNLNQAELKKCNIKIKKISRGGFATYHGPGQLVVYPVINLKNYNLTVKSYIFSLESLIIELLGEFNITGFKKEEYIGVWTKEGKIASIGVAVKKGCVFHGFALNVNTNLNFFNYIIPCGIKGIKMTSMEQILSEKIKMDKVKEVCIKKLRKIF